MQKIFDWFTNRLHSIDFDYKRPASFGAVLFICSMLFYSCMGPGPKAVIVADTTNAPLPVLHGIQKLHEQLVSNDYDVETVSTPEDTKGDLFFVAGLASGENEAIKQLKAMNKELPKGKEGLVIQKGTRQGSPLVVLCGSDANGLMYALLDVGRRIELQKGEDDMLALVKNVHEQADLVERSISTYTMQRAWLEKRIYSEDYLKHYFDQLAESRINNYAVIFGYENGGFLAPPYPYFFDTEGFPGVEMANITGEQQQKNVKAFRRMIELAHERGISITVGIWDHIYRGGVQDGGLAEEDEGAEARVTGVNNENLTAYTLKAFNKFLQVFPNIDRIQFRMHPESGLTREEMPAFWHKVFGLIAENQPGMPVDIRAKQLPDEIINDGINQGLKIRVTTKYWMEQMGLPFHPTHINRQNQQGRRHGYADLLKYPQRYKVHWRLWNGGTTRILLWGNPEYCRRIAQSAHLYDGNSIEFNEPLATKMEAQPHDVEPFDLLSPDYQYYDFEFERYWYFFDVFGRMGYNPKPPEKLWEAEFKRHYGSKAGTYVRKGLHLASQILPRIVASSYNYRYFPTTRGWAEKMHFGNLERFSNGGGTDIQQFVSFEEEAENMINGLNDLRTSVFETSRWYTAMADSIWQAVNKAEEAKGKTEDGEFLSTLTDLKILAELSRFYSQRVKAAVYYNLFEVSHSIISLEKAIKYEQKAIDAWQGIVDAAGDVYPKDLMMGICRMNMCGHWEDDLKQLKADLAKLKALKSEIKEEEGKGPLKIHHIPVRQIKPGDKLPVEVEVRHGNVGSVQCAIKTSEGEYRYVELTKQNQWIYRGEAEIPSKESMVFYYIVASDGKGYKSFFPEIGDQGLVKVMITPDTTGPEATVERIESAPVGKPLTVTAKVNDPSGVNWVRLRYRHVTQIEDYQSVEMKWDEEKGVYTGTIPGSFIVPKWDVMYFIETMDMAGNGKQYPDFEKQAPYVMVKLER